MGVWRCYRGSLSFFEIIHPAASEKGKADWLQNHMWMDTHAPRHLACAQSIDENDSDDGSVVVTPLLEWVVNPSFHGQFDNARS
jgi:hypothetical protein